MKDLILKYFYKYKETVLYIFFGGITTVINIVSYYIAYNILNIENVISTIIAWILSVIFAYISNKLWVFNSKSWNFEIAFKEFISFISVRLLTGGIDVGIMYIGVDLFNYNGLLMKVLSNVIVLVSNYVGSKLFIFNNKEQK